MLLKQLCLSDSSIHPAFPMAQTHQRMVIESERVPIWYNLAATAASWTILAGFFILPGTLTSLKEQPHVFGDSQVVKTVVNNPLLPLAAICYVTGAVGLVILW